MSAIQTIVNTLATAVKGIVDAATGTQNDQKMNLGDQDDPSGASAAGNTLMEKELTRMQHRQEMMQQQMQDMAGNSGGSGSDQSFGGIRS